MRSRSACLWRRYVILRGGGGEVSQSRGRVRSFRGDGAAMFGQFFRGARSGRSGGIGGSGAVFGERAGLREGALDARQDGGRPGGGDSPCDLNRAGNGPEVEYVRSGETGLLCSDNSSEALAAGVREILADRERYSANALAYAKEHLTLDRMVDGLEAAIRHAILNRAGAG